MGQIKIYGNTETIKAKRAAISDAIHTSVMDALKYPKEKRFQRFIKLDSEDFIYPSDRSTNYLIIEIFIFEGRSIEAKKSLIKQLYTNFAAINISPNDLEINIIESPKHNWGIRGVPGDELSINYKVEV